MSDFFKIYFNKRIFLLVFLGAASGLPLPLTLSTLTIWMAESGVSKTAIGLFALAGMPYALKFLWAPVVDSLKIPFLTNLLGRRRAWILISQAMLIFSIIGLGLSSPSVDPMMTGVMALFVAFSSATQDIVLDAYRVEILEEHQYGAGAASFVFGYRLGMLISGAGALYLATYFNWSVVYFVMAFVVFAGMVATFMGPRPHVLPSKKRTHWLKESVIDPFVDFTTRHNWWFILLFVVAYKLGDALAGIMSNPFYLELGFEKIDIANITKVFGLAATLIGGFIGGSMVGRYGIYKSLFICGILQMASNLMFAVLAVTGKDLGILTLTIGVENLSGGMGTTAFVAYLSMLCSKQYTATQYALLSALASIGRTMLSSSGGALADTLNWPLFFVLTTLIALPGVLMVKWLRK